MFISKFNIYIYLYKIVDQNGILPFIPFYDKKEHQLSSPFGSKKLEQ